MPIGSLDRFIGSGVKLKKLL